MTQEQKKSRAVALWAVADMFRSGSDQDSELEAIGQACDLAAIRYAEEAGTTYEELRENVEDCPITQAYEAIAI